ncbi:MAG: Co2+/Mg2+ efflux protein ApaG [Sphingopyxis sp.]
MIGALFPYALTTGDVTVRAAVSFQPENSQASASRWFWIYHIRIENHGDTPVQLIDRSWEITDGRGAVHLVEGSGVVGEQPVIAPGASFDYVSGCPLATPSGRMIGHFGMIDAAGRQFSVKVPELRLLGPAVSR